MNYNITKFFKEINIDHLAFETGFCRRAPRKISPTNFLLSFFMCFSQSHYSIRQWAFCLSQLTGKVVSFQSIDKKIQFGKKDFIVELVNRLFLSNIEKIAAKGIGILAKFDRVLIQDSTLVQLPQSHYGYSSGVSNSTSVKAISRIQTVFDLLTNSIIKLEKCSYSQSDMAYSKHILDIIREGDLIIRDLGYFVTSVFAQINNKGAYFLSKLHMSVLLFNCNTHKEIDLVKLIKANEKKGIYNFDLEVLLSNKNKIPVRLVGYRVTQEQARKKRKLQILSRHKNCKITYKSKFLTRYNLFICNISSDHLDIEELYQLYSLRWTIEMMFKDWKHNFNLQKLMYCSKTPNEARPEMLLHLMMLYILIIVKPNFIIIAAMIKKVHNKYLSPLKFSRYIKALFKPDTDLTTEFNLELLSRYACYDKRSDRRSVAEICDELILLS